MGDRTEFLDALDGLKQRFIDLIENKTPLGIMSGLKAMDQLLGGFKPCELSIIAARTGIGKTAFMIQMAREAYLEGKRVAFFSLEMPTVQIMSRMLIGYAKINATILSHGGAGFDEIEKNEAKRALHEGVDNLKSLNSSGDLGKFWIIDTRRISVDAIKKHCRDMGDLDMVFVDYIQLVSPPKEEKAKDRHIQVGEVSMQLHALAKDLDCPVIAGAQIKRLGRGNKPGLEDLRESGSLEQDSDQVIILDRETDENDALPKQGFGSISVLKNRHGLGGVCPFYYTGRHFLFEDPETSQNMVIYENEEPKGRSNMSTPQKETLPRTIGDKPRQGTTKQEHDLFGLF